MGGFTAILLAACCLVLARRTVARS